MAMINTLNKYLILYKEYEEKKNYQTFPKENYKQCVIKKIIEIYTEFKTPYEWWNYLNEIIMNME